MKEKLELYVFNDEENAGVSVKVISGAFTRPRIYPAGSSDLSLDEASILALRYIIRFLGGKKFDKIYISNERVFKLVNMEELLEDGDKLLHNLTSLQEDLSSNNIELAYIEGESNPAKFKYLHEVYPPEKENPTKRKAEKKTKNSA